MGERFRQLLLRVLKVPAEPSAPPGDPELVRTFRASPHYFRYKVAVWLMKQASAFIGLLVSYYFFRNFFFVFQAFGGHWIGVVELIAIAVFIAQLPFSYALLRLDFEMRWYILSDRSLRIREGTLSVHEQTMAFANIQNLSVRQNPLQRLFGISTVVVRAAGGGSGTSQKGPHGAASSGSHEATFEGVDNAEQIRTAIRERIRLHRDAGLGDPDDTSRERRPAAPAAALRHGAAPAVSLGPAIEAAHRLLGEATRLRTELG
jgi:uncharacterized membrane protein YdbT with pleckstrin-like domain